VVFARETADVWIQKRIREHPDPTSITVVTADREILETARAYRAGSIRVSEFLQLPRPSRKRRRQERTAEKPDHQSERQIEEWRRLFEEPREDE
jgi:predicted RNA-binding protein with PIN domain